MKTRESEELRKASERRAEKFEKRLRVESIRMAPSRGRRFFFHVSSCRSTGGKHIPYPSSPLSFIEFFSPSFIAQDYSKQTTSPLSSAQRAARNVLPLSSCLRSCKNLSRSATCWTISCSSILFASSTRPAFSSSH